MITQICPEIIFKPSPLRRWADWPNTFLTIKYSKISKARKIQKIHVFHGKSFIFNLLLQVTPKKTKFYSSFTWFS
jgi:hypothetical protein